MEFKAESCSMYLNLMRLKFNPYSTWKWNILIYMKTESAKKDGFGKTANKSSIRSWPK